MSEPRCTRVVVGLAVPRKIRVVQLVRALASVQCVFSDALSLSEPGSSRTRTAGEPTPVGAGITGRARC